MDLFYLPKLEETRRYCFVAVDRATRLVYVSALEHKEAACAEAFFKECLCFFAFGIQKISWHRRQPDLFIKGPTSLLRYRNLFTMNCPAASCGVSELTRGFSLKHR